MRICVGTILVIALILPSCASTLGARCAANEKRLVTSHLFFGTAMPDGAVSQAQWSQFLQSVVTPRFPEGFTVWEASGQWRSSDGSVVREPSHVLQVIYPEGEARDAALSEIMSEYKAQFRQEAVLKTRGAVCASF